MLMVIPDVGSEMFWSHLKLAGWFRHTSGSTDSKDSLKIKIINLFARAYFRPRPSLLLVDCLLKQSPAETIGRF